MREENFDFLKNQVKFTGFGEGLENLIRGKMEKGEDAFTISHRMEYGNDKLDAELHFSKSDEKDLYFFNKYDLSLKKEGESTEMKQSFLVSPKHTTYTAKEAYNLMSGRAVNKKMSAMQKVSDEGGSRLKPTGNKFTAWVQLDFNDADKYGNFKQKIFSGSEKLDVPKALEGQPIKELQGEDPRKWLVESLHRGNRHEVTFLEDGKERKAYLQADPKNAAIRQFDEKGKELKPIKAAEEKKEGQSEKQGEKQDEKPGESTRKSNMQKQETGVEAGKKEGQKQERRRGPRVG